MEVQAVAVMGVSGWFMTANNLLLLSSDDAGYENAYGKPLGDSCPFSSLLKNHFITSVGW
jgi:hypothetical protein